MRPTRLTACFVMQTKWQHAFLTWKASNHCVVHIGVNTYGHSLQVTWSASWFCHFLIFHTQFWCAIIVSQSCAVGKSGIFWRATGQSNSANRMKNCSIGQGAVVWVRKPNFGSFWCGQSFVYQVWLFSGPPEFSTFSYCAWLWDWLEVGRIQFNISHI